MPSLTLMLIWLKNWFITGNASYGHRTDGTIVSHRLNGAVATIAVMAESIGSGKVSGSAATQVVSQAKKEIVAESKKVVGVGQMKKNLSELLKNAVIQINRWSYEQRRARKGDNDDLVVIVAAIYKQTLSIAHVGNSRAYLFRNARLARLTVDQTGIQALIADGNVPRSEERTHPARTNLLHSLGKQSSVEVDTQLLNPSTAVSQLRRPTSLELQPNDLILLASSAVMEQLDDQQIQEIMTRHSPIKAARQLVGKAKAGGATNARMLVIPYRPAFYQWARRFYESFVFLLKLLIFPLLFVVALNVIYLVQYDWTTIDSVRGLFQVERSWFVQAMCYPLLQPDCPALIELTQGTPTATPIEKATIPEPVVVPLATETSTTSPVAPTQANENAISSPRLRITDTPVIKPIDTPTEVVPSTPLPVPTLVVIATLPITPTAAFATTETATSTAIPSSTETVTNTTPVTITEIVTITPPNSLPLVVDLISPSRDVIEAQGKVDFKWRAELLPPAGLGYQIIFWPPGKTPQTGFGIHELIFEKSFARTIPLDELADQLDDKLLVPNKTYNWAVCLFDPAANRITEHCSADSRTIVFRR